jgi:hypothetical protein
MSEELFMDAQSAAQVSHRTNPSIGISDRDVAQRFVHRNCGQDRDGEEPIFD